MKTVLGQLKRHSGTARNDEFTKVATASTKMKMEPKTGTRPAHCILGTSNNHDNHGYTLHTSTRSPSTVNFPAGNLLHCAETKLRWSFAPRGELLFAPTAARQLS